MEPRTPRTPDKADGGIRRVLTALEKYLPEFGIRVVKKIDKADLTAGHVDHLPLADGKPFVSHNHGMYWQDYFKKQFHYEVNRDITSCLIRADAITAPSQWVANALSYGLLRTPRAIYHGVDVDEWQPQAEHGNYVLWNKARADEVSDPQDMLNLASQMPHVQFISTLGNKTGNVKLCGVTNYGEHKVIIQKAGVYLATARETFGIGTLEALASGVPVAGWDYGGQSEIILQGETGYLAPFGNYALLAECVTKCFNERTRLSANARQDAISRWQWLDKIEQYANLYKETLENWTKPRPKVSVIVTCHNLARFLPDALNSLLHQTLADWECIVVDDASTDNTAAIAEQFVQADSRIHYHKPLENLKLSRALNFGHAHATGRYVMNLDADNILPEHALEILSDALDKRRDLHVVYGALETMNEDGTNRKPNAFPYPVYDNYSWNGQIAHMNQLHSSAMMRREVIEQSAGYRERQWRAEDAEFWTRVSSFGFRIERVTDQPTLVYRWRSDSKSIRERQENQDIDGDWVEYFPWRTARNGEDGKKVVAKSTQAVANPQLVPFGAQGNRTDKVFWDVYHRQNPLVSVIIPVGPGHTRYLNDALDSLIGQVTNEWEAIVVNDTGEDWTAVRGAPWARVIVNTGKHGAGVARNLGVKHAKGELLFFLDADDMLHPNALIEMVRQYGRGDAGYIYSDALVPESQNKSKVVTAPEFTQDGWLKRGLHSQAVLIGKEDFWSIGGFNEEMLAWEDWDFFVKCISSGICGVRVPEPLLLYRKHLGKRSEFGDAHRQELFNELKTRYRDYTTGAKQMGKCGRCGKKAQDAANKSQMMQTRVDVPDKPIQPGYVRMRYTGARTAPVTYYANKHGYQAANTPKWRHLDVPIADKDGLIATGVFVEVPVKTFVPIEIVSQAQPVEAPVAAPAQVAEPVRVESTVVVAGVKSEPQPIVVTPPPSNPIAETPAPKRVITAEMMQQAVAAMEKKTGKTIQPKTPQQRIEAERVNQKQVEPIAQPEPQPEPEKPKRKPRGRKAAEAAA